MTRPARCQWLLAVVVAAIVTVGQVIFPPRPVPPIPIIDAAVYTTLAHQIASEGTMGTGGSTAEPAMIMAPLYPAFLAGLMRLDPGLKDMAGCVRKSPDRSSPDLPCPHHKGISLVVQTIIAIAAGFMVWALGTTLVGPACGWLAMLLALATGHYASTAAQFLTENLVMPLFSALLLCFITALRQGKAWQWGLTGLLLGLLTLTRPSYGYLAGAFVAVAVTAALLRPRSNAPKATFMLVACCGVTLAPWLLRNWLLCGRFGITAGYDAQTFLQRLGYNQMTPREWLVSFLYWQPDIGEKLATALLDFDAWRRLSWEGDESLYRITWPLYPADALPDMATQMRERFLPHLGWHVTVTFALAWRGLWLMRWWGLVTIPAAVAGMARAAARQRWELLLFCAPAWFMLGFHAFVSVNVVRYNLILIPSLTVMAAWMVLECGGRLRARLRRAA